MEYNLLENLIYCGDIVREALPALLYAHVPTALVTLLLGIFIAVKARKMLLAKIFLFICGSFFVWAFLNLSIWVNYDKGNILMYAWSLIESFSIALFALSFYFSYVFIVKDDLPVWAKALGTLLVLPVFALAPTKWNLVYYDIQECVAVENLNYLNYVLLVKIIFTVLTVAIMAYGLVKNSREEKKEIGVLFAGIIGFLFAFLVAGRVGEITGNYFYEIYGLFAMFLFLGALTHLIVKFQVFHLKIVAVQALVAVIVIIAGAQYTYAATTISKILVSLSVFLSLIFGFVLVRSVKNTILQKEQLAVLNAELNDLIKQRENLVHLVTHKVKGSFTRSKYIFAGILEGMFGEVSYEIKKRAEQGLESDNMGIQTVDLVLSVANMQKGTVKYDMKKIDFKDLALKSVAEKKMSAEARGLTIETDIKESKYEVIGDAFWLKEVVNNLVENSIKYTKEGLITVGLEKKEGKILLSVKDTGLGISDEDKKNLFTEGGRGKDSVKINVDSTGYGLYSVKLIIDAHKGRVWGQSAGPGKGSQFYVELSAA